MTSWMFFPRSDRPPQLGLEVVRVFEQAGSHIDSGAHNLSSNQVLSHVAAGLVAAGFRAELGKRAEDAVRVPVLFGLNGKLEKYFDADAYHEEGGFVVEVEAGRAIDNYGFLKDLFQACMMHNVNYLAIAVRKVYRGRQDFEVVCRFMETMYTSQRLKLPLRGVLVIGY